MDIGLINRKNIINRFYDNFRNYKLKYGWDHLVVINDPVRENYIEYNTSTGQINFNMTLNFSAKKNEYVESYFNGNLREETQHLSHTFTVLSYNNPGLEMVSTTSSDWISKVRDSYYAVRDLKIDKIPITEEEHFQQMTVSDLLLDLEDFIKIQEMIETMHHIGCIVQVNENISVDLRFEETIRGNTRAA